MGVEVLRAPEEASDATYGAQLLAFEAQSASIDELAESFSSHLNLKDVLVDMVMSPWFMPSANWSNMALDAFPLLTGRPENRKSKLPESVKRHIITLYGIFDSFVNGSLTLAESTKALFTS